MTTPRKSLPEHIRELDELAGDRPEIDIRDPKGCAWIIFGTLAGIAIVIASIGLYKYLAHHP